MTQEFEGTMPVADRNKFDEAALDAYMRAYVEGYQGPLKVAQFKGGQSNPTYRISTPSKDYVLRSKPGPAAKLLPSAHAVDREFRVQSALYKNGFPVSRQYALCEDEAVLGRAFYIMDCVEGRVIWEQSLPGMEPAERGAIYAEMNRVIALLHNANAAQIGLETYGKPGNYFGRQIERWSKQYRLSETEKIDAMDNLIEWLPKNIPAGEQISIVHGDYRLDNMIFHPTEPRVLAVLDWELSTLGHPLADFSYHCMTYRIEPGQFRGIAGLDFKALGIPSEQEYIDSYCKATGLSINQRDWGFYAAYNMFRLAAILQGIVKRAADGTASSERAGEQGSRTRPLAEQGWAQAMKQ